MLSCRPPKSGLLFYLIALSGLLFYLIALILLT